MHPPPAFAARAAQNKKAVVRPRDAGGAASCIKQRTPRSRSLKLGRTSAAEALGQPYLLKCTPFLEGRRSGHRLQRATRPDVAVDVRAVRRVPAQACQTKRTVSGGPGYIIGWRVQPRSTASPALIAREVPERTNIHRAITAFPGKLACIPRALPHAHTCSRAHTERKITARHGYG